MQMWQLKHSWNELVYNDKSGCWCSFTSITWAMLIWSLYSCYASSCRLISFIVCVWPILMCSLLGIHAFSCSNWCYLSLAKRAGWFHHKLIPYSGLVAEDKKGFSTPTMASSSPGGLVEEWMSKKKDVLMWNLLQRWKHKVGTRQKQRYPSFGSLYFKQNVSRLVINISKSFFSPQVSQDKAQKSGLLWLDL